MDEGTVILISVIAVVTTMLVAFTLFDYMRYRHTEKMQSMENEYYEKMASMGYEEMPLMGTEKTIWVKKY